MRTACLLLGVVALPVFGCTGQVVGAGTAGEGVADTPGAGTGLSIDELPACAGEGGLLPPQLRRLTPLQYGNTLRATFGDAIGPEQLPDFQDDNPTVGLANDPARLRVTTVSIDAIYAAARSASVAIAGQHAPVSDCIGDSDDACFEALADELGASLWRRPMEPEERADLLSGLDAVAAAGGTRAQQMDLLLQALLMSPNTLYRTEVGGGSGALRQLSGYELASLLSYTLSDGPPDAELMALADGEALYDADTLMAEAQRLMTGERFAQSVAAFFWDYLKLDNIHTVAKDERLGLTPDARADLAQSAEASLLSRLSDADAPFMDVFRGQDFEMNAGAAAFFGVDSAPAGAQSTVRAPADEREGMLTHPAFLAVHAGRGNSGIVKRGVFTLEQLLGYDLPDPPDNISGVDPGELPDYDPDTTSSRELLKLTHSRQERCMSCHQIIDPAGFGYEQYDAVGRYRTTEKQDVPIDASGELALAGEALQFDDSVGYMRAMADSAAMRRAVLKNYFAYAMGRPASDCEMERFDGAVGSAGDQLRALAENIVLTDSFIVREEQQ